MARRSDHSRDELAALVLGAAREIVQEKGGTGLTMRGIAERIGYAAGSIYNVVGDLQAVRLQVDADTLMRLAGRLEQALAATAPTASPAERTVVLAMAYMAFVAENNPLWSALLDLRLRAGTTVPAWFQHHRTRLLAIVSDVIAPLYPDPAARRRAVVALWAALQGISSLAASGSLDFALDGLDASDIARSLVLRYLSGSEIS